MFLPPDVAAARGSRRPRRCDAAGLAVRRGRGRAVPARHRPRSDRAADGRRRRPRRSVQHGRRSVALLPHAAGGGALGGARVLSRRDRRADDRAVDAAGMRDVRGLGWDIDSLVLLESRRAVSARIVRTHRLHRHVAVARSASRRATSIFLSNRVHPDGKGDVTPLRGTGRDGRGGGAAVG